MSSPSPTPPIVASTHLVVGMVGYIDPRLFEDHPSYLLDDNLPTHIQDLFEEWGQPIPIAIEYLEDEVELRATISNVNMHLKSIDFDMEDTAFDCDIDVEFHNRVTYRQKRLYGITTNYFVVE